MSSHARLAPSNDRWPNCPGSVREEASYPDIPGAAAIDGTGSHLLLEFCLFNDLDASEYIGRIIGVAHEDKSTGWLVNSERANRVQYCLNYVKNRVDELRRKYGDTINVEPESKSDPGLLVGRSDWNGTCDITITVIDKNLGMIYCEIIDYKDGRGYVSEKENTQLISYLIGKVANNIAVDCRVTIVQPKTTPPIRYQDIPFAKIKSELNRLEIAALATDDPNAPLIPGSWCKWCKHKPNCQAIGATVDLNKDFSTLSDVELAEIYDQKKLIVERFKALDLEIKKRLDTGRQVDGFGLFPGKRAFEWYDKEEASKQLICLGLDPKDFKTLVSPAEVRKLIKDFDDDISDEVDKLIKTVPGKKVIGRSRLPQKESANDMFADVLKPSFI